MTPAIAEALASVLDIIGAHCDANEGRDIWPSGLAFAGDRLGVALGLDIDARWQDVAEALRALARPDVGLPEGWAIEAHDDGPAAIGPNDEQVFVDEDGDLRLFRCAPWIPIPVVVALLRAAGVAP